jgi:hypothetical protein
LRIERKSKTYRERELIIKIKCIEERKKRKEKKERIKKE